MQTFAASTTVGLNAILTGDEFEIAIEKTNGFSFAHLRETYITGAQSAFEQARDVTVADIIEAIDLQVGGAQELKTASGSAPGFIRTMSKPDSSSSAGSSGIRLCTNPEIHKLFEEQMLKEV